MADPDVPGYTQDRLRSQAPGVLPTNSLAEMGRAVRDALQAVYRELSALSSRRNVVALQGDMAARDGQFIAGIAAGQVITLPSPNPGDAGQISVLVTAVKSACTVVNPDASTFTLSVAGLYEFGISPDDTAWKAVYPAAPIALSSLAAQAANTVVANATAAAASPTAFPLGTNVVLGRVAGNIVAAQLVGAQVAPATLPLTTIATQAANTIVANATAGVASPTAVACGAESVFGQTSGNLQGIASAVQTALIRAAGSVFWAAAAANQVLRRSGVGDLGFGLLVDGNLTTNTISAASQAQMAANTVKSNATAALANESDLAVGTNTVVGRVAGNLVAAQLVAAQVTNNTLTYAQIAQPAANTMPANATAGAANLADLAVGANTVVGRVAGNIVAAAAVNAQLAAMTANSLKGEATGASVAPQDIALAVQSLLARAAGNVTNLAATTGQFLGRSYAGGDLAFQALPGLGALLRAPQILTATNAAFAHPTGTRVIVCQLIGGGGGGGGATATAGSAGNGGNAANWGMFSFTSVSGTSNVTIGGAGTTGAGVAGGNGGDSSVVHNAVTLTVRGGTGGGVLAGAALVAAAAQNAGNAANAGATVSITGISGAEAFRNAAAAVAAISGDGGGGPMGEGGRQQGGLNAAGRPANGFGAGGGGAINGSGAAALAGGAATAGLAIFWEFG